MNKHQVFFTLLFSLFVQIVCGQKTDYIATDTTLNSGVILIPGSPSENAKWIRVQGKGRLFKYYPDQILEYGLRNGTIYKSKQITIDGKEKTVFLERLEDGQVKLYFFSEAGTRTFFIEEDNKGLTEISKDNYQEHLSNYASDFDGAATQVKFTKYNRGSLSRLVEIFNEKQSRPLPFNRVGITAGLSRTNLKVRSDNANQPLNRIGFTPSSSFNIGVFGDFPILMSDFSVNTGINISSASYSVNSSGLDSDVDLLIDFTTINIPIMIRYTWPFMNLRPFLNIGITYSYHSNKSSDLYETTFNQNEILINRSDESLITDSMWGTTVGAGIQKRLRERNIVSVEARLHQLKGQRGQLNKNQFEFLLGYSF